MGEFIESVLAIIGLLTVLYGVAVLLFEDEAPQPDIPDAYRDGMESAARISAAAWQAEQALHHAARESERRER